MGLVLEYAVEFVRVDVADFEEVEVEEWERAGDMEELLDCYGHFDEGEWEGVPVNYELLFVLQRGDFCNWFDPDIDLYDNDWYYIWCL